MCLNFISFNLDRAVLAKNWDPFALNFMAPHCWSQVSEATILVLCDAGQLCEFAFSTMFLVVVVFDKFLATIVEIVALKFKLTQQFPHCKVGWSECSQLTMHHALVPLVSLVLCDARSAKDRGTRFALDRVV